MKYCEVIPLGRDNAGYRVPGRLFRLGDHRGGLCYLGSARSLSLLLCQCPTAPATMCRYLLDLISDDVRSMNLLHDSRVLVGVTELAEIIGTDPLTIDNWIRRGMISRTPIRGRQLRNRLFSTEEVYKTALKYELVKLGIPPSLASEAVNAFWKEWGKKEIPEGWNVYAVLVPSNDEWNVALWAQKIPRGPLYKLGKSMGSKSIEMDLPKQAFAVIPISDVLDRITNKLLELLGEIKNHGAKGKP